MTNYKYTIQIFTISGKYLNTFHFKKKAEMMAMIADRISFGYQVKAMEYSVWVNECNN